MSVPPSYQQQGVPAGYAARPTDARLPTGVPINDEMPVKERRESSGSAGPADELQKSHGWRDLPWAIIFWLHLLALLIPGFICYRKYHNDFAPTGSSDSDNLGPLEHALPLLGACLALGAVISMLALYMMKNHGIVLIWASLILLLVTSLAVVVLSALAGSVVGVVICGLMFLFSCWYVYAVRPRIPFAAAMMDVALRAMGEFKTAWFLPIIGMGMMGLLAYLWSISAMSIVYAVDNGGNSGAKSARGFIFFLLVLSFFWTAFVVRGWVHTCIAGVQATWYFLVPDSVPDHPVLGAIKRASTTSFGSICFGSFLVAMIRTVRFFVNLAYQNARNSNNNLAACALCFLECIIGCLESLVNYINQYAFAICAIYGTPFLASASQAWGLMKSRGFDAVINDSLINGVLNMCIIIAGLATGILGALAAKYAYDSDWRPWLGAGFVCGAVLMLVISEIVESAVISLFICLADDPVTLQRTKPDAYRRIMDPISSRQDTDTLAPCA